MRSATGGLGRVVDVVVTAGWLDDLEDLGCTRHVKSPRNEIVNVRRALSRGVGSRPSDSTSVQSAEVRKPPTVVRKMSDLRPNLSGDASRVLEMAW